MAGTAGWKITSIQIAKYIHVLSRCPRNIQPGCWKGALHFQRQKTCAVYFTELDRLIAQKDNASLGKQPLCLIPHQHCNLITPRVNMWIPAPEHSLRMLTIRLFPGMRHLQLRQWEQWTSFMLPAFIACWRVLAAYTWDLEKGTAIVFNHPLGEICLEDHVLKWSTAR